MPRGLRRTPFHRGPGAFRTNRYAEGNQRVTQRVVTEEGRRASDIINGHLVAQPDCWNRWVALRLSDGGSDGVLYDTRGDAIRHQLHESLCAYVQIPPDGMPPDDASQFLLITAKFYDKGFRLTDPEDPREPIMPYTDEELARVVADFRRSWK